MKLKIGDRVKRVGKGTVHVPHSTEGTVITVNENCAGIHWDNGFGRSGFGDSYNINEDITMEILIEPIYKIARCDCTNFGKISPRNNSVVRPNFQCKNEAEHAFINIHSKLIHYCNDHAREMAILYPEKIV